MLRIFVFCLFFSLSLAHSLFSTTYVWEDYDDFSSTELNANNWISAWWSGAQPASVSSEYLKLSGSGVAYSPISLNPRGSDPLLSSMPQQPTMHSFAEINANGIYGIEADVMIPANAPISTGVGIVGFRFNPDGTKHSMGIELGYWSPGSGLEFEYENETPPVGQGIEKSTYDGALGNWYKLSLIHTASKGYLLRDGTVILEFDTTYDPNWYGFMSFNDEGNPYEVFVDNVRVLRRSTTTTQPDPVTVVSDPNEQAVVVQVGNEYQWNSTLDGVTMWSVSESERDGKWSALTAKFSGGNLLYGFEFKDDVADTGNNKVTYQIDENGYIKSLEDDGDYQYYNPVIVENGVVGTIENDQGVDSVANNGINQVDQWFFTTRAAAEEYYYSKVNPKDWMWFDNYPWVYSNEMQEWLYFYPSGGTLMYWSNKGQAWRQFN